MVITMTSRNIHKVICNVINTLTRIWKYYNCRIISQEHSPTPMQDSCSLVGGSCGPEMAAQCYGVLRKPSRPSYVSTLISTALLITSETTNLLLYQIRLLKNFYHLIVTNQFRVEFYHIFTKRTFVQLNY